MLQILDEAHLVKSSSAKRSTRLSKCEPPCVPSTVPLGSLALRHLHSCCTKKHALRDMYCCSAERHRINMRQLHSVLPSSV